MRCFRDTDLDELPWIRRAEQEAPKPNKGFAGFLRQALDAVIAGLTLP